MKASIFLTSAVSLCTAAASSGRTTSDQRRSVLEQRATPATNGSCPDIWYAIAADLKLNFLGCNRLAADAIRFAFHDAAGYSSTNQPYSPASGGADGSLLLSDDEIARGKNDPLQGYRDFLLLKFDFYKDSGISAADFVQAAGNIGTVSCPGGPAVKTVIGRTDSFQAAPEGTLPEAFGPQSKQDVLIQLWADKGFSPRELAALMGAHSVSKAFVQQANGIPAGSPQDDTPNAWDVRYYSQTQAKTAPRGVFRFDSDVNLADPSTASGAAFTEFAGSQASWADAFSAAAYKLSVLGVSQERQSGFLDCTGILG